MNRSVVIEETGSFVLAVLVLMFAFPPNPGPAFGQTGTSRVMSDTLVFSPERADKKITSDGNLVFETRVIYRGLVPSAGPAVVGNFGVMYKGFLLYLYGGAGFSNKYPTNVGNYQESDINLFYYRPKWSAGFNYYYNYTVGITTVHEPTGMFDFDSETARAVLDLIVRVQFGQENQWELMSSTYVWGPRDSKGKEITDANGNRVAVHGEQRHSQYVALRRSWHVGEDNKVGATIGGSWAWTSDDNSTFYGDKAGINNIKLEVTRYLRPTAKLLIPAEAIAVYNPLSDDMFVYFSIELVQNRKIKH